VAHVPWGAHPSPTPGYYNRDHQGFLEYHAGSRTAADFAGWLAHWVAPTAARDAYLARLGPERLAGLALKQHLLAEAADYGY
jgi:glutaconate CoA-transferase subunit A